jgi:hypothetical protein
VQEMREPFPTFCPRETEPATSTGGLQNADDESRLRSTAACRDMGDSKAPIKLPYPGIRIARGRDRSRISKTRRHDATGGLLVFSRRDHAARCDGRAIFANAAVTVRKAASCQRVSASSKNPVTLSVVI